MIKYIAILFFLFSNFVFDNFAPPRNMGWSCFFFFANYFSFSLIALEEVFKSKDIIKKKIQLGISLVLLARGGYELSLCNLPYDQYLNSANSDLSSFCFVIVFILYFLVIFVKN